MYNANSNAFGKDYIAKWPSCPSAAIYKPCLLSGSAHTIQAGLILFLRRLRIRV